MRDEISLELLPFGLVPSVQALPKVTVSLKALAASLELTFHNFDPEEQIDWPSPKEEASRRDGLWKGTCFEFFQSTLKGAAYREWNFCPNGDWQAYDFSSYRHPSPPVPSSNLSPPHIHKRDCSLCVKLKNISRQEMKLFNLTAMIKLKTGELLAYAPKHLALKPDFHDKQTFISWDEQH